MKTFKEYLNKPTPSVEEIAKKHSTSVRAIQTELRKGISVEREHTDENAVATEIALDHLNEKPDYYRQLKKAKL